MLASPRALELAGIDGPRSFGQAAEVACDAAGRPTGLLLEDAACALVEAVVPAVSLAERCARASSVLASMAAAGLTGGHAMDGAGLDVLAALEDRGVPGRDRRRPSTSQRRGARSRRQDPLCNLGKMDAVRLAAIRFFAGLPEDELAAVASVASEAEIPPGQLLAAQGRVGYSLYAVESGTADVVINGETVGTIGAGDVVGEMAVLISPPDWSAPPEVAIGGSRTASIVATSPMRLITLFKRDVWALDRRTPVMTQRLRALLDERQAQDAERALGNQRAQGEQGDSPGSDPPADNA